MTFHSKPGIYTDVSAADYFADPCPDPSLTQSIAKVLIDQSPLHAWTAHPRLNPDYVHDDDTKYDVGNVAHGLMIGRGKEIIVLDAYGDWRTKAAQEARAAAVMQGKIAVLGKTFARASNMVEAAREQLALRDLGHLLNQETGIGEVVIAWQEDDIWLRQMIDWLEVERLTFCDYKTTGMSAAPHGLDRMMATAGWPIQAAMAERGLDVLDPENAGRRRYLFVVQEDTRPYALNVVELTEGPMTMGRKMLQHGVDIWRRCIEADRWPGYPAEIVRPSYPGWAETQWLDREIAHADKHDHQRETMLTDLRGG
jgi:PDDEXK-like domain of unknown function (DUF3799)